MAFPQVARLCGITVPDRDAPQNKELALSAASQNSTLLSHAVLVSRSALWENGTVLDYSFFGGSQLQRAKVEEVIQEWTWYANISFRRVPDNNARATLRVAFDPSKGSWSYVGNTAKSCAGPAPTINLGWIADTDSLTKKERGVILHEFGHVLGLMHEHESPARSGVLRLKEREIIQYYTETQGWDEDTVRKQVLDVYSKESVSNYSQFDPTSIMMYFMPGSMNEGGVDVHEVTELSMLDKAFIVANYPRSEPHPNAPQWTPAFALLAAGADSEAVQAYNATSDVDEKREIFTRDMVDRRMREVKPQGNNVVVPASTVQTGSNTSSQPTASIDDKFIQDIIDQLNLSGSQTTEAKPRGNNVVAPASNAQTSSNTSFQPTASNDDKLIQDFINQLNLSSSQTTEAKPRGNNVVAPASNAQTSSNTSFQPAASNDDKLIQDFINQLNLSSSQTTQVKPRGNNVVPASNAQTGSNTSFRSTASNDDKFIQDIIDQLNLSASQQTTVSKPVKTQPAPQGAAHAEMVQNGILSMILKIAPMILLAPNAPAPSPGSPYVSHAVLDPNNLSFEHPAVQHGLFSFFTKLASNETVKKVMAGAVKVAGGVVSDFVGNLLPQNAVDSSVLDPQNGLLNDGFTMLVRKVVAHQVFQDAVKDIAGVARTNGAQNLAYSNASYVGPQNALQVAAHAEKVQNGIFSMLLDLAPKELLAPKVNTQGSSDVSYAVLDPHNLSLDHPVVQHGLMSFFSKLASNDIVKKVMAGAVKVAGGVVSDFVGNLVPKTQNAFNTESGFNTDYATGNYNGNTNSNLNSQYPSNTNTFEPQNGLISDGLSTLVKKIVDHKLFKETLELAKSVGVQNGAYQTTDSAELAYRQRMNKVSAEIWRRGGPSAAGRIVQEMERASQQFARA